MNAVLTVHWSAISHKLELRNSERRLFFTVNRKIFFLSLTSVVQKVNSILVPQYFRLYWRLGPRIFAVEKFSFFIALLSVEQLSWNQTRLHQPKTKSMWGYSSSPTERSRGRILRTNQIFNSDQCNNKKSSFSRGTSYKYDCVFVRPQSLNITKFYINKDT